MAYNNKSLKLLSATAIFVSCLETLATPTPPPPPPSSFNKEPSPSSIPSVVDIHQQSLFKRFNFLFFPSSPNNKGKINTPKGGNIKDLLSDIKKGNTGLKTISETATDTNTSSLREAVLERRLQVTRGKGNKKFTPQPKLSTEEKIKQQLTELSKTLDGLRENDIELHTNPEIEKKKVGIIGKTSIKSYVENFKLPNFENIELILIKRENGNELDKGENKIVAHYKNLTSTVEKLEELARENKRLIANEERARKRVEDKTPKKIAEQKARRAKMAAQKIKARQNEYNKVIEKALQSATPINHYQTAQAKAKAVLDAKILDPDITVTRTKNLHEREFEGLLKNNILPKAEDFYGNKAKTSTEVKNFRKEYENQVRDLIANSLTTEDLQEILPNIKRLDETGKLNLIYNIINEFSNKSEIKPRPKESNPLLNAIEGFNKNKLKKAPTKIVTSAKQEENDTLFNKFKQVGDGKIPVRQPIGEIETSEGVKTNVTGKKVTKRSLFIKQLAKNIGQQPEQQAVTLEFAKSNSITAYYQLIKQGRQEHWNEWLKIERRKLEERKLSSPKKEKIILPAYVEPDIKINARQFNLCVKHDILPTAKEMYSKKKSDKVEFIIKNIEDLNKLELKNKLIEIAIRNPDGIDAFFLLMEKYDKEIGRLITTTLTDEEKELLKAADLTLHELPTEEAEKKALTREELNEKATKKLRVARKNRLKGEIYKPGVSGSLDTEVKIGKNSRASKKVGENASTIDSEATASEKLDSTNDKEATASEKPDNTNDKDDTKKNISTGQKLKTKLTKLTIDYSNIIANISSFINNTIINKRIKNLAASSDSEYQPENYAWMSVIKGNSNQTTNQDVAGYKGKSFGFSFGMEFTPKEDVFLGAAYSYVNSNFKFQDTFQGTNIAAHNNIITLYGKTILSKKLVLNGQFLYNHAFTKIGIIGQESKKLPVDNISLQSKLAYTLYDQKSITFIPFLGIAYNNSLLNKRDQIDTDSLNINLAKVGRHDLSILLGSGLSYEKNLSNGFNLTFDLNLAVQKDLISRKKGKDLQSRSPNLFCSVGPDISLVKDNFLVKFDYDIHLQKNYFGHQGSLQLKILF